MKKDTAEQAIIAEMRRRLPSVPYTGIGGGLRQFNELMTDRPDLFAFQSRVEKWQLVQGWVRKRNMIS
jgi:hypothetical protein